MLSDAKIEVVISSACNTLGQPCIESELRYLQALAKEMQHSRLQQKQLGNINQFHDLSVDSKVLDLT